MTDTVSLDNQQALPVRIIGRGQPVLMLPGLGMNSAQWLPFVVPHSRRFRFYLPDFRGQGRAAHLRFTGDDVFESHADDVEQLVQHFGLQDIFLVAHRKLHEDPQHAERPDAWLRGVAVNVARNRRRSPRQPH